MRGIKVLLGKSRELSKPLVINLSFSTNEGNAAHHVGGTLTNTQSFTVNVGPD